MTLQTIKYVRMLENEPDRIAEADDVLRPLKVNVETIAVRNAYDPREALQGIKPGTILVYDVHIQDLAGQSHKGDGIEAARLLAIELVSRYQTQGITPSHQRLSPYLLAFVTTDASKVLNTADLAKDAVLDANGNPARPLGRVAGIEGIDVTYRGKFKLAGSAQTVTYGQTLKQLVQDAEEHYTALLAGSPLPRSKIRILNPSWVGSIDNKVEGKSDLEL